MEKKVKKKKNSWPPKGHTPHVEDLSIIRCVSIHAVHPLWMTAPYLWLQSTSMAYEKVTEETVYTCTGHPLRSDITNILDWSLNKDFTSAYKRILQSNSFSLRSIYSALLCCWLISLFVISPASRLQAAPLFQRLSWTIHKFFIHQRSGWCSWCH